MRVPNKVNICGKTYTIKKNKNMWGGRGTTGKQEVVVGTKRDQSNERIFENYLHEITELVACEQTLKFTASDDECVIVITHKQFDRFVNGVASAIYPMVK